MKCKDVSDKKICSLRKLCSQVHGAVFDNKAFMIPSTNRRHVNASDEIGCFVISNLENCHFIHGAMFDCKAFIIPFTIRWNVKL
jgi:hypothetical protein